MNTFNINNYTGDKTYEIGKKTFIIAEIGSTHCASLENAKLLMNVAKLSNVDCVKFQKRDIQTLLTKKEIEREYKSKNSMAPTYGEHRKIMEFSEDDFRELQEEANKLGLFFTASGWDKKSIDFLDELNVPFIKVASADLTNIPLLEHIAKKKRPVFLSTGMANLYDVLNAYNIIKKYENRIVLFQCTSSYPAPFSELNLNVLSTYKEMFKDVVLGYSGHELGTIIPSVAVSLGARVIEKHFTLDNNSVGSDHKTALEPNELEKMVKNIKTTEKSLGEYKKEIQSSEEPCIKKLCKSIASTQKIKKGDVLTEKMITTKSPGYGISAKKFYQIIGKKALVDIEEDTTIMEEDISP